MSESVPAKAAPVPTKTKTEEPRKLDDVLLAMDVVDTIRHRERIVDVELNAQQREEQLVTRLKEIYGAQGIEVPDRILKDGVKALEEQRFVYRPPPKSFNTSLALAYVNRKRWLPATLILMVMAAAVAGVSVFSIRAGEAEWRNMPAQIERLSAEGQRLAIDPAVDAQIAGIAREGQRAVAAKDKGDAKAAVASLEAMNTQLGAEYDVRIVSRPGEDTGFYRTPDDSPNGRNYYIVVEGVAPGGRVLSLPVRNEENQKTEDVSMWAQRVDESVFNRVAEDKSGDQIIQNDVLGRKAIGELAPDYEPGVQGGAITSW